MTFNSKAVLESKWPAADNSSTLMWNRLRNVIIGVAQFRQGLKNKTRRSLSLSSETELDRVSRTSTESSNPEDMTLVRISNPAEFVPELIKLNDENYSGNILVNYSNLFLIFIKIDICICLAQFLVYTIFNQGSVKDFIYLGFSFREKRNFCKT